ncbi:MAG: sulfite exporter TauE/SafE family protein [Chloroflexota bacterium]
MTSDITILWVVVMIGAMMQGMTGLGFALVSVPVLLLFMDARTVIVTTLILTSLLNALILLQTRKQMSWKDAAPITIGSILGVPFGSYLLMALNPEALKAIVAMLAILFSIPLLMGFRRKIQHQQAACMVTGAVSGALQSCTSMGSPPVALFLANQGFSKDSFRGTLVLRSMAASTLSVVALMPTGLLNSNVALLALMMAPAVLMGFAVGSLLVKAVPQRLFKKLAILSIASTATLSLISTLI